GERGSRHSRRAADERRLLLLRKGERRWWTADGNGRTRCLSALRRHRFTGGGPPDDEARLCGVIRPLSQLSDSVARLAGKSAGAGAAADDLAAAIALVSGSVWRRATAGRARGPRTHAGRRLSAADAADRRTHRTPPPGAGARDRRRRR